MKASKFYESLIRILERIYYRVTLSLLHRRIAGYHRQSPQEIKPYAGNIKGPLMQCIKAIEYNGLLELDDPNPMDASDVASLHIPDQYNIAELHLLDNGRFAELAQYFKSRHNNSALNSGIEEKLEHSTWEHIHAVVRCAKQGSSLSAKMHADIASTACNELAHFMPEKEYNGFIGEIKMYLDVLKAKQ